MLGKQIARIISTTTPHQLEASVRHYCGTPVTHITCKRHHHKIPDTSLVHQCSEQTHHSNTLDHTAHTRPQRQHQNAATATTVNREGKNEFTVGVRSKVDQRRRGYSTSVATTAATTMNTTLTPIACLLVASLELGYSEQLVAGASGQSDVPHTWTGAVELIAEMG